MTSDLYRPTRQEFLALATERALVPIVREVLADLQTPLAVYDRLRGEPGPTFLLESVEQGLHWGRYSFIGLRPLLDLIARDGTVTLTGDLPASAADEIRAVAATGDPLRTLAALLAALGTGEDAAAPATRPSLPPLFAGAVGYLGWETVRFIEDIPATGTDDLGMPDVHLCFPGQVVAFDHLRQRLLVVSNVLVGEDPAAQWDAAVAASERLVALLGTPVPSTPIAPPRAVTVTDAEATMTRADYERSVTQAQEHIRAGDVFQVVASQRFWLDTDVDPFLVYRVLRVINPSPYMYVFDFSDTPDGSCIVGSSPEALVTVRDGVASIWPIAGSQPRSDDDAADRAFEAVLRSDQKEQAEHVMLVDLARNDLGRVCELGTVRVGEFMDVVRYSHIMHLRSTVTGTVTPGTSSVDVLRATFPAGTLSGAPKVRAMQLIDELEPTRRGLFGGGIGYLDLAGNLDLCIAIRTLLFRAGRAHVQAGAGIVADSVPAAEYAETQHKAMALLAAVRAAEDLTAADSVVRGTGAVAEVGL